MAIVRAQVIRSILRKVGLPRGSKRRLDIPYLTKNELVHLNSWIDTAKDVVKSRSTAGSAGE